MATPDIKKQLSNYLWVEKYRPTTIIGDGFDIILPNSYKTYFSNLIKEGQIPNLILHSVSPGVGKTSLAKALCYDLGCDFRYINISANGGIDTLRNDIQKYASMKSLNGKPKIVIMDEAEGAGNSLNLALRAALEEFKNSCRFIFTCNNISKIIEPIKSRCAVFDFNMSDPNILKEVKPKVVDRLTSILEFEEISYKLETVETMVDTFFPDIRKMIGLCQKYSSMTKSIDENIFRCESIDEEFYSYVLEKKFGKARKYLIDKNYNYSELYRELFDNVVPRLDTSKQGPAILVIGEFMYKHSTVIDPEINAACCLLELMSNI